MNNPSSSEGGLPSQQQTQGDPQVVQQKPTLSPEQVEANKAVMLARVEKWVDSDNHNVTNPNLQR